MSIQDAIKTLDETELFAVRTSWEGEETPRYVYITQEVARFLWEPEEVDKKLSKRAKAVVDGFIEGGHISVGWSPINKGASCVMARVGTPNSDYEIWDFRCLAPKPGVRILGGFAEKDVFVCVTWDYRQNFDGAWPQQIGRCIDEWQRLFGSDVPYRGRRVDEYLSQPFEVV